MDITEFGLRLRQLREHRSLRTNACLTRPQQESLLSDPRCEIRTTEHLLLLSKREAELRRLYFYADGEAGFSELMEYCRESSDKLPYVIDVAGRNGSSDPLVSKLTEYGFTHYSRFIRMGCRHVTPIPYDILIPVEYAKPEESLILRTMLVQEFDPLFSHIPEESELSSALARQEITVTRAQDGTIQGFSWFEPISPQKKRFRYFLVSPEYRGAGIGSVLLMHEFTQFMGAYELWVGTYNPTIKLHERLGFEPDGLNDDILVFGKQQPKHGIGDDI